MIIVMQIFALILDNYNTRYYLYDNFAEINGFGSEHTEAGHEHFESPDLDFHLEMMNISLQFVAFPLYNYSINNYWRGQLEKE